MVWEERQVMKRKMIVPIVCVALVVGILSGCVEPEVKNKPPTASFTYSPTENIYINITITFTDASTDKDGTIAAWSWDFGDGTTSTDDNPTHKYTAIGPYTVTLIVTDNDGANGTTTKSITVDYKPPTADFTYTPMTNITVNVTTVTFTDNSTIGDAALTNWTWDFGDGSNLSYGNETTHIFLINGTITVTLTVKDANGLEGVATKTIEVL